MDEDIVDYSQKISLKNDEKPNIEQDNLTESAIPMGSVTNNSHVGSFENILDQMAEKPSEKKESENSFEKKRQIPKNKKSEEKEESKEEEESEENEVENEEEEEEEEEEQESISKINICARWHYHGLDRKWVCHHNSKFINLCYRRNRGYLEWKRSGYRLHQQCNYFIKVYLYWRNCWPCI